MKMIRESNKEYVKLMNETELENPDDFEKLYIYMKLTETGENKDVLPFKI